MIAVRPAVGIAALHAILTKGDVERPVRPFSTIQCRQMTCHGFGNVLPVKLQTGDEVARLVAVLFRLIGKGALCAGHDDAAVFESLPFVEHILVELLHQSRWQDVGFSFFQPSMPVVLAEKRI